MVEGGMVGRLDDGLDDGPHLSGTVENVDASAQVT
jgi:hypothetical protein